MRSAGHARDSGRLSQNGLAVRARALRGVERAQQALVELEAVGAELAFKQHAEQHEQRCVHVRRDLQHVLCIEL